MKINFKYFILIFSLLILIQNAYSLECSPEGRIIEVEISIDDNSFTSDFNGTSGIIQKLTYNPSFNQYSLWQTDKLSFRTDKGQVVFKNPTYTSLDFNIDSITTTNNDKLMIVNTSLYNTLYVKTRGKNTGSCINFNINDGHKRWFSTLQNVGGSNLSISQSFFNSNFFYLDPNEEVTWITSQNINNFYSGKFLIATSWRSTIPPTFYQVFYISLYFEGRNFINPVVSIQEGSEMHHPLIENKTYNIVYKIENFDSINSYNLSYAFHIESYLYPYYTAKQIFLNSSSESFTILPGQTKLISLNYTIPAEGELIPINYLSRWFQAYLIDPYMGRLLLSYYWIPIGNYNHEYLNPYFLQNIVIGTTNQGFPYVGGKYQLFEWGLLYPKSISSNLFKENIIVFKYEGSGWFQENVDSRDILETFSPGEKKYYYYYYNLYDFVNWENSKVKIWIETIWKEKNLLQFRDKSDRNNFILNLDFSHLLMSTDLPLYIYSNNGSKDVYVRDILFNLKDYKLRNVSLKINIIDPLSGISSDYFNVSNPNNFDVPAQSSYPIPINIKYLGPNQDKRYTIMINYSYYDEINNINKSKMLYGDIYIKPDLVSRNYNDLIPIMLSYDNLYLNKRSKIEVIFKNQGNSFITSSHKVSLYYKNLNETNFHLIGSKNVLANLKLVEFNFTPTQTGKIIVKAVIDEDNNINENSIYSLEGENNNELASITFVRDIDLVLKSAKPNYKNITTQGIIPFEIEVYNQGTGGVDEFIIDLNISRGNEFWYFNETFQNIPEKGRNFTYYWNVTNVTPGFHLYLAKVIPLYDKDYSNNIKNGGMDFCALPWYGSSILDCFDMCSQSCTNPITKRFKKSCENIGGCHFYNSTFASQCDGALENTYVEFNKTHEALCPDASIIKLKQFTNQTINITGNCTKIIIKNRPVLFKGENVIMKIINCFK